MLFAAPRGLFLTDMCISIYTYKLSVKGHLIQKFVKLFCTASAEPFRGEPRAV